MNNNNYSYAAPPPQMMTMTQTLDQTARHGAVIRQSSQWDEAILEAIGVPYERSNQYMIYHLPPGIRAAKTHNDPTAWHPTDEDLKNLPPLGRVQEESSVCMRILLSMTGWLNMRGFTLHFTNPYGQEMMTATRKCAFGGCCCDPSTLHVHEGQYHLGDISEDFSPYCDKCSESCCQCTHYFKILERTQTGLNHNYSLRVNQCCCGRVNNCCGATCCREDFIIDVIDAKDRSKVVSTIQMPYAPSVEGNCKACCRAMNNYNNYIVEFPPNITPIQRSLILSSVFQPEYYFFEREKRNDNDN